MNRLRNHVVRLDRVTEYRVRPLDHDPKSPPTIVVRYLTNRGSKVAQIEATASSSRDERKKIAELFSTIGLEVGNVNRYVEW